MGVVRTPQGRFKAVHKVGREYAGAKTFDRKADAVEWLARQRKLAVGLSPEGSKRKLSAWLADYMVERARAVRSTTFATDSHLLANIPISLRNRSVSSIRVGDIEQLLRDRAAAGAAWASVKRYRESLGSFFEWLVKQHAIAANPVRGAVLPRRTVPRREIRPWNKDELPEVVGRWIALDYDMGNVAGFLATSGLRWSEARELRGADVDPLGEFVKVGRARPESEREPRPTKSGHSRTAPVPELARDYVLHNRLKLL